MALADYINEAIAIIAKSEIAKASSYDKTIICKVIKVYEERTNYYRVSNENINFDAKVLNGETYEVNDEVYVMIPQGDYNLEKLIIGKFSSSEKEKEVVELVGNKIIEVENISLESFAFGSPIELNNRLDYNPNKITSNPLLPTAWGVYLGFDTNLVGVDNIPSFEVMITLSKTNKDEDGKVINKNDIASLTYALKNTQGSILNLSPYIPIKTFNLEKCTDLDTANSVTITTKYYHKLEESSSNQNWEDKNGHYITLKNVNLIFGYSIDSYESKNKILIQRADKTPNGLIMELTSAIEDVELDLNMDLVSEQYYAGELVTWTRKENSNFRFKGANDALTISQKSPNITLIVPGGTNLNNGDDDTLTVSTTKNDKRYIGEAKIWVSYGNDYNFQFDIIPNGIETNTALNSKCSWATYQTAYFGQSPNILLQMGKPNENNYLYSAGIPGSPVLEKISESSSSKNNVETISNGVYMGKVAIGHKYFQGYSILSNVQSYRATEYRYKSFKSNTQTTSLFEKGSKLGESSYFEPSFNEYTGKITSKGTTITLSETVENFYQITGDANYVQYSLKGVSTDVDGTIRLEYTLYRFSIKEATSSNDYTYDWGTEGGYDYPVVAKSENNIITIKTLSSLYPYREMTNEKAIQIIESSPEEYTMKLEINLNAKNDYYELKSFFKHVPYLYVVYDDLPSCYKEYRGLNSDGKLELDGKIVEEDFSSASSFSNVYLYNNSNYAYFGVIKKSNDQYVFEFNQEIKSLKLKSEQSYELAETGILKIQQLKDTYTLGTKEDDWGRRIAFTLGSIVEQPDQITEDNIINKAKNNYYNNIYFAQINEWNPPPTSEQPKALSVCPESIIAQPMQIFCNYYQGNGKYGRYSPNKIQIPFIPQIIYFISNNQVYSWFNPQSSFNIKHIPNEAQFTNGEFIWYNNQNASSQLNSLGAQVNWIALG